MSVMRRWWVPLGLLALSTVARASDPAPARAAPGPVDVAGFWTKDELARIDRGLEMLNLDRKDLGFQKRPIDDPFRLDVVNQALDEPLSVGPQAMKWDEVARAGDAGKLLWRARTVLGLTPTEHPSEDVETTVELPGISAALKSALVLFVGDLQLAREPVATMRASLGDGADAVLRKAFLTQVEKPVIAPPGAELADEAFLAAVAKVDRVVELNEAEELLAATQDLVRELKALKPEAISIPKEGLRLPSKAGAIVISGIGDDVHDEGDDVCCVIDLGGNDVWKRGA